MNKGIRPAFGADLRRWSVTGEHGDIVAEREYFFLYPFEQKIDISSRQIPAADTAGKEHVAADEQFIFARKETKTAGTMTWDFEHLHFKPEKTSCWCFFDQQVGLHRFDFQLESEVAKEFRIGNHRHGFRMTTDLAIEAAFDFGDIRNVIEVPVREKQQF